MLRTTINRADMTEMLRRKCDNERFWSAGVAPCINTPLRPISQVQHVYKRHSIPGTESNIGLAHLMLLMAETQITEKSHQSPLPYTELPGGVSLIQ